MSRLILLPVPLLLLTSCINVNIPNEFKGELTVNLKVARELNDFFGDIDEKSKTINLPPEGVTAPAKP